MKIPAFDEFVAIDWSGATEGYTGIAVAACEAGEGAPALLGPNGGRWTRTEIAEWLSAKLQSRKRCLVGLDFAFGFPFEEQCGYLGGRTRVDDIFELWSLINEKSGKDADFGCASFVQDPDHTHLFWMRSTRPPDWVNRKRMTELACAEATGTHPDTVYKLIGPKQVGKASLTGIRVLHHVRSRTAGVAVWPFEPVRASALVEIYPTLFRRQATRNVGKIRTWAALNKALQHFGSLPIRNRSGRAPSDHETDALLSAAGLRAIAGNADLWRISELDSTRIRREGWIFGVKEIQGRTPNF
jgi:hypothetical protein